MAEFDPASLAENVALGPMTTLGIGGPARYFYKAETRTSLQDAIAWSQEQKLPLLILGGGSNLVIDDAGFPGLVLLPALMGRDYRLEGNHCHVRVGAGETWDALVADTVSRNLAGIECMSGIPGRVGAAPIQNIGAYGQELAQCFEGLEALDLQRGEVRSFTKAECGFGYRTSIFKHGPQAGRFLVLEVSLMLELNGAPLVAYPDLRSRLTGSATLAQVRAAVLDVRASKSMLENADDPNARSCGSFFTNPIVSAETFARIHPLLGPNAPHYPSADGTVKLSAAWLIEQAGFTRGLVRPGVGLSQKHCLALINRGNGSAAQVIALMHEIQQGVAARFQVALEPEPVIIGAIKPGHPPFQEIKPGHPPFQEKE